MSVKKRRIKLPPWVFGLAGAALWFVIGVIGVAALRSGGSDIEPKEFPPRFSVDAPVPDGLELDTALLKRSFMYADIESLSPDDTLLAKNGGEVPPAKLQPVFNAVFSKDGLQIASLKDSRLKCRAEAIVPLSEMLDGFYNATGLRTIMINAAYEPDASAAAGKCAEHNNGYSFDFGIYLKDSDRRTAFTIESDYRWFAAHAWEYGFVQRYPQGSEELTGVAARDDHFRYVGRVAARILTENSLCFEQLDEFMRGHTIDDPLVLNDGGSYVVVYYHKLDESRKVPVPATKEGEPLPCEAYYIGKDRKAVIAAVRPTVEFFTEAKAPTEPDLDLDIDG
ncbi:MAG: D-alanyl-D-alanine carboxypeptidase family protein [Ruminococcus sp.]|nr:D-alanyl-D-alanine carboxypeptidase family protein [Ruminococcus sp.]